VKEIGYSPEAYEKAEYILSEYRRASVQKLEERTIAVYEQIPEIKETEEQITELGIELARSSLSGKVSENEFTSLESRLAGLEKRKADLLASAGYPSDYLSNASNCSLCHDTGYTKGVMCSCMKKILSEFDLSVDIRQFGFNDFRLDIYSEEIIPRYNVSPRNQMKNVLDYCKNYVETFSCNSDNILMYGGAGLGKTFICNCIAKELSDRGYNVILSSAYNIFELVSKNKFNYKADFSTDISRFYDCDLLIMDDLGTEFTTEYTISALFDIINQRMTQGKPTVINANLSLQDMSNRYSDRIVSRLLTFRHLLFLGNDIRAMNLK